MSDLGGGYNGNASLKRLGVEISYTKEQVAEIVKCSEDPIYFIKNLNSQSQMPNHQNKTINL